MTKEERKARRFANKTKRKERKSGRKEKFDELMTKVHETPGFPDDGSTPDYVQNFMTYWPLIKSALDFVEKTRITRPKMDLQIQRIVILGDGIANDPDSDPDSEFTQKSQKAWRVIRTILIAFTVFISSAKNEDRIDKLIEIGDWITRLEGND